MLQVLFRKETVDVSGFHCSVLTERDSYRVAGPFHIEHPTQMHVYNSESNHYRIMPVHSGWLRR
jgi:hypothetical protein